MSKFQIIVLSLLGLIACVILAGIGMFSFYLWGFQENQQAQVNQQQSTIMPTATPEPTSAPPTPTSIPTPIPENIKTYVTRVRDIANTYIDQLNTIYKILDYSDFQSDAWIAEIITHISKADSLYSELNTLVPPSDLETFHRDLYLAMGYCQEAFDEIRTAIDLNDNIGEATNKMENAVKLSRICNDRLTSHDRSKYYEYRNNILSSEESEDLYLNEMTRLASDLKERLDTLGELFLNPKFDQPWVENILLNTGLIHSDYKIATSYNNAVPDKYQRVHEMLVDALYDCDKAATLIEEAFADNWQNNLDYVATKMEDAIIHVSNCSEKTSVVGAEFAVLNGKK